MNHARVKMQGGMYTRHAFPMRLAFARTAYKVQGRTIDTQLVVIADSLPQAGEAYVAYSRVTSIDKLCIILHKPENTALQPEMFKPHTPN